MPDIPFLGDWNAVLNGCLNDDDSKGIQQAGRVPRNAISRPGT